MSTIFISQDENSRIQKYKELKEGFSDDDQKVVNDALLFFSRYSLSKNQPRKMTGKVYTWTEGNIATVDRTQTLPEVLKILITENFTGVPVLDTDLSYFGWIDLLDVVTFATNIFTGETQELWVDFFEKRSEWKTAQVHDVMRANPYTDRRKTLRSDHPVPQGLSLLTAMETLARTKCGRLAVLNNVNRVVGILTESMVISILRQFLPRMKPIVGIKLGKAGLVQGSKNVKIVYETDRTLDAFHALVKHNVSGMPILDKKGLLVGNLSLRDLRAVGPKGERFQYFYKTVGQFKDMALKIHKQQAPSSHYSERDLPDILYLTEQNSLSDAIEMMNDGNIHRVYICDSSEAKEGKLRVVGVVSQYDILNYVLTAMGIGCDWSLSYRVKEDSEGKSNKGQDEGGEEKMKQ